MPRFRFTVIASIAISTLAYADATPTHIAAADVATAIKLRDQAMNDGTAYAIVAGLSTEIGPRLAGGMNDQRARDWVAARFKALGFDKVTSEPVKFPRWVRNSEHAEIIAPYPQKLAVLALGGSVGTPKGGISADVVAFKTLDELKAASAAQVKDKIAYIGFHMAASKDGHTYGEAVGARVVGASLAAGFGAKAIVIRSIGSDNERMPHTGVLQYDPKIARIPAAAISNSDADLLEHMLTLGQPVRLNLALDCGTQGEYTGANVIGEITGSEHPEEVIVIGGHLDSWDPGTGAIDDGAGVAITMAAAHLIGQLPQRPKRTIRVVAFANEEAGMYGANAYAEAHKNDVAKHLIGSESDFGAGRIWRLSAQVKPEALGAIDQIMQLLAPLGVERGGDHAHGGDFGAMGAQGMAILDLGQDGTDYFNWHHTANDTMDKIDPKALAQNVAVYATYAYMAAQAVGDFGSKPGAFASAKEED